MSGHARLLDRVSRLADEHVIDAVYVIRHRPYHWPVVIGFAAIGGLVGLLVPVAPWFFAPALAFIGMGLGMNLRTDFRLLARTPSRVLLLDASSVHARPTRVAGGVSRDQVALRARPCWGAVTIRGVAHLTAKHHLPRLRRMFDLQG